MGVVEGDDGIFNGKSGREEDANRIISESGGSILSMIGFLLLGCRVGVELWSWILNLNMLRPGP
jgi:hypothetical protein